MSKDVTVLDEIIQGRVEPYIYAFSTNTFPNYLKVGDTYRSVTERLNEWKKYYPNLKKEFEGTAKINEDLFFRDHSIHKFLIVEKHKTRLLASNVPKGVYFSNEFFENTKVEDVEEAIDDIKQSYENKKNKYLLYNVKNTSPKNFTFARIETYKPRPNQAITIENFKKAIKKRRTNLLMYAVMRFGKSFTSMCCAKEINSKLVVVVSAKADVKLEWKKTVESHVDFSEYVFLTSDDLEKNNKIVAKTLKNKKVVVFLTLQDLQGEVLKDKHKEIFKRKIDLLIIDETHFGARAEQYGKVLLPVDEIKAMKHKNDSDDFVEINEADEQIKVLDAKVRLHLSGTPYRILMGSEFTKDDIIAFYQFSNIVDDQEEWNNKYLLNDDYQEWDNPYYGFPQMIRFAFNPNESSLKKMEQLKNSGVTYALSELFRPKSIIKDSENNSHKKFENEKEVLDLFKIIDGSKDDSNILGFLNYEKIKEGNMCRHIVIVLPYCASCDALEYLIKEHKEEFLNLKEYEIINISGVDNQNLYISTEDIKNKIKECENNGIKTITLTVNRMLTGTTVEYWDTMIYLKNTASPQEYDQAIFRLQNQYIKTYENEDGDVIKYNMKPQTLLVDFDPARLFIMQEQKAQIYNVNIDKSGNSKLEERLRRELEISPIIALNHDKIVKITPTDILQEISNYSKNKGVVDEASSLPVDLGLMQYEDILKEINAQSKLGTKEGLSIKPAEGEGDNIDTPEQNNTNDNTDESYNQSNTNPVEKKEDVYKDFKERFKMYYARILFFAFLTDDEVKSVDDIISVIDKKDNKRISKNLLLHKSMLKTIRKYINKFYLSQIDYKIQNLNNLSKDTSLTPLERAKNAIAKFDRLSNSEIITSNILCTDMIDLIPKENIIALFNENKPILDIASKSAEFAVAIYNKYISKVDNEKLKNLIYSIPTSPHAYEFTRKIYRILGLNIDNIAVYFDSYKLLNFVKSNGDIDYDKIVKFLTQNKKYSKIQIKNEINGGKQMKFSAVVGNPPYQISDGGARASSKPIYHHFVKISKKLTPSYISIITPTRWFAGGKGLDDFRDEMLLDKHIQKIYDFLDPSILFPNTNIRGGVCYFLWNSKYDNSINLVNVITHDSKNIISNINRPMKFDGIDIFVRDGRAISILNKLKDANSNYIEEYVSTRKPFGLDGFFVTDSNFKNEDIGMINPLKCIGKGKKIGYVERNLITVNVDWIDKYKVFIPRANNIGTELNDDNLNAFVGKPNVICTESYLAIGAKLNMNEEQAINLVKYLKTKFVRFLHSLAKASQDATSKTFKFVPLQNLNNPSDINWNDSIENIDKQLYSKYNLTKEEIEYINATIKPMN